MVFHYNIIATKSHRSPNNHHQIPSIIPEILIKSMKTSAISHGAWDFSVGCGFSCSVLIRKDTLKKAFQRKMTETQDQRLSGIQDCGRHVPGFLPLGFHCMQLLPSRKISATSTSLPAAWAGPSCLRNILRITLPDPMLMAMQSWIFL